MSLFEAILLGLVQGVTEFLPVSSTGHLVLVRDFLNIDTANVLAFDGMLHLATTLAVVVYFWSDIWTLLQAMLRKLGRLPVNEKDITLCYALLLGTIPAIILGFLIEPYFNKNLQSAGIVAILLLVSSVFLMYAEWRCYIRPTYEPVIPKRGLLIGLFQAFALLPGFSRSGSAMAGGMMLGLSRYEATRFSFLLAIPITFGIGVRKLLTLISIGGSVEWIPILVGCTTAFLIAILVIHFFLSYVRKYTLWPFIWYGVVLSALVGYVNLIS